MKTPLVEIGDRLTANLKSMRFKRPVTHVYNPLEYARLPWERYVELYGQQPRRVVFLGMNPGPYGMAQTGIPFGEIAAVRDWMGIREKVGKPCDEHSKRPILGFDCPRSEVSGQRLWGWARSRYGTPERFFRHFFVLNYCPLVFMEESGRNLTPDHLPPRERATLFGVCDQALREMVTVLRPEWVIGVGAFAENRAREALDGFSGVPGVSVKVGRILHPSPASPKANRGWAAAIEKELTALGISLA
ncbi:uracil-DNA glycosylase family protein [Bdellovibrionota bacterium FG-1]